MFRTVSLSVGTKASPLRSYVSLTRYPSSMPCQYIRRPASGRYKNDLRPRYHASVVASLARIEQNSFAPASQCRQIVNACLGNFTLVYSRQVDRRDHGCAIQTPRCPPTMVTAISFAKTIPPMFLYTVE